MKLPDKTLGQLEEGVGVRLRLRYNQLLPKIREVARAHGYAVAVHGSEERDFDLVAIPWTEEAVDAEELVEELRIAVKGYILENQNGQQNMSRKPHGRRAWSIHIGGHDYIDLSVMPRRRKKATAK